MIWNAFADQKRGKVVRKVVAVVKEQIVGLHSTQTLAFIHIEDSGV